MKIRITYRSIISALMCVLGSFVCTAALATPQLIPGMTTKSVMTQSNILDNAKAFCGFDSDSDVYIPDSSAEFIEMIESNNNIADSIARGEAPENIASGDELRHPDNKTQTVRYYLLSEKTYSITKHLWIKHSAHFCGAYDWFQRNYPNLAAMTDTPEESDDLLESLRGSQIVKPGSGSGSGSGSGFDSDSNRKKQLSTLVLEGQFPKKVMPMNLHHELHPGIILGNNLFKPHFTFSNIKIDSTAAKGIDRLFLVGYQHIVFNGIYYKDATISYAKTDSLNFKDMEIVDHSGARNLLIGFLWFGSTFKDEGSSFYYRNTRHTIYMYNPRHLELKNTYFYNSGSGTVIELFGIETPKYSPTPHILSNVTIEAPKGSHITGLVMKDFDYGWKYSPKLQNWHFKGDVKNGFVFRPTFYYDYEEGVKDWVRKEFYPRLAEPAPEHLSTWDGSPDGSPCTGGLSSPVEFFPGIVCGVLPTMAPTVTMPSAERTVPTTETQAPTTQDVTTGTPRQNKTTQATTVTPLATEPTELWPTNAETNSVTTPASNGAYTGNYPPMLNTVITIGVLGLMLVM